MIKKLINLANYLDGSGLDKEADWVDALMGIAKSASQMKMSLAEFEAVSSKVSGLQGFGLKTIVSGELNPCDWKNPRDSIDFHLQVNGLRLPMAFIYTSFEYGESTSIKNINDAEIKSSKKREDLFRALISERCKTESVPDADVVALGVMGIKKDPEITQEVVDNKHEVNSGIFVGFYENGMAVCVEKIGSFSPNAPNANNFLYSTVSAQAFPCYNQGVHRVQTAVAPQAEPTSPRPVTDTGCWAKDSDGFVLPAPCVDK
jgi:hypothetical protein